MAKQMRAGRMIAVNDMQCVDTTVPELREGEVMVKTTMASICGSDLHLVCHGAGVSHSFPCPHGYPGHEAIGSVRLTLGRSTKEHEIARAGKSLVQAWHELI